ncbi:MAG: glycosyltransferase family 4 protein [Methanobacteriota archaeon]|nr:MAG: glycosyltransferase family 4 protein [Euryarchaeota archaeon]
MTPTIDSGNCAHMKIAMIRSRNRVVMRHIADSLSDRGHEVPLYSVLFRGVDKESYPGEVVVGRFPNWADRKRFGTLLGYGRYLSKLARTVDDVDVVLVRNVFPCGHGGVMLQKLKGMPSVLMLQGENDLFNFDEAHWTVDRLRPIVVKESSKIIAQTSYQRDFLEKEYGVTSAVLPNGVDVERFKPIPKDEARKELGLDVSSKYIVSVGAFLPFKGIDYLIHAFTRVVESIPNARLLLLGDGAQRKQLRRLTRDLKVEDSVLFHGWVPFEKMPQYLSASDLFVHPSTSEGFPNVVLEAMASGLPIVMSNVVGLGDYFQDNRNCFFVPPRDEKSLEEKMLVLLRDEALVEEMRERNLEDVKGHDWSVFAEKLEGILEGVMDSSK